MFDSNKQKLLIEYLISNVDTFALAKSITQPQYFDVSLRKAVAFLHEYYDAYNALPTTDIIKVESGVDLKLHEITRDKVKYCCEQIEKFCREQALYAAAIAAPKLIAEGRGSEVELAIKDALLVSLNRRIGIDYFADPVSRIEEHALQAVLIPTKWKPFDDAVGGGLGRKQLVLFSANSGGGKSLTLANLGINFLEQGYNVLYLTLELSEELVSQRYDTMLTGVPSVLWQQQRKEIGSALLQMGPSMGKLVIKHMSSGSTSNHIRAYLKEYELTYGHVPDLLIVDYIDIMGSNTYVPAGNVWEKDKLVSEQLRDIAVDYNAVVATASQQNRSAIEAESLNQGHIAGGITKVNTCDLYASILLTEANKAAGDIGFAFLKTRNSNAVGTTVYLKYVTKSLRIRNHDKDEMIDEDGVFKDRITSLRNRKEKVATFEDLLSMS